MRNVILPSVYSTEEEIKKLIKISRKDYKDTVFYLLGLPFNGSYYESVHPDIFFQIDKKFITPIVDDLMPQHIDNAIKKIKSSIEWNKSRVIDEEEELEKLIKLKEKYK